MTLRVSCHLNIRSSAVNGGSVGLAAKEDGKAVVVLMGLFAGEPFPTLLKMDQAENLRVSIALVYEGSIVRRPTSASCPVLAHIRDEGASSVYCIHASTWALHSDLNRDKVWSQPVNGASVCSFHSQTTLA